MPLHGLPKTLRAVINKTKRAGNKSLEEVAENIRRRMSEEGKPVKYPIRWDSQKQRKAFFATNGFGGGIPHKRTHKMRLGWKVKAITQGTKTGVSITNKRRGAGAVFGLPRTGWQSRIHRGTWNYLPKIFLQEVKKLPLIVMKNVRIEFK